jgi:hypothetical protein
MNPTPSEWPVRVALESVLAAGLLSLLAGWLAGITTTLGVVAGGVLAAGNFWWLAGRAVAVTAGSAGGGWLLGFALRFGALAAACGALLASGWAHPVALVAGLSVLPCVLVARGLGRMHEAR